MAFIDEQSAKPLAAALLVCLSQQVALLERPPSNVSLRPGAQAVIGIATRRDECCEGVAWVRTASIAPSSTANWPSPDVTPYGVPGGCGPQRLAVVFELGIVRCSPTPSASGIISDEQWNALSELILDDYAAMYRAFCCFQQQFNTRPMLVGQWTPLGPDGNCIGGSMNVTVAAPPCNCGPLESPS